MEKSRSWPSAHDWKSCIPQKGIEGSNPSFSARKVRMNSTFIRTFFNLATVAQSVEQLIRNQQVAGSSPASSSNPLRVMSEGVLLFGQERKQFWKFIIHFRMKLNTKNIISALNSLNGVTAVCSQCIHR